MLKEIQKRANKKRDIHASASLTQRKPSIVPSQKPDLTKLIALSKNEDATSEQIISAVQEFATQAQGLTKLSETPGATAAVDTASVVKPAANTNALNRPMPKTFIRISPDVPQRPEDKIKVFLENTLHA